MVSVWFIVANVLLPIPLALFVLLIIPSPRNVRTGILLFCTQVFDLKLVGAFRLLHMAFFFTSIAFLSALRQLQTVRSQQQLGMFSSPNQEIALLSKKWRTERNLWIAAFAFSAWAGLAALYREAQRRAKAENELAQLKLVAEEMEEISSQGGRANLPLPKVVEETGGGSNQLGKEEVLDGDTTSRKENVASAGDVELTAKPALEKKDE